VLLRLCRCCCCLCCCCCCCTPSRNTHGHTQRGRTADGGQQVCAEGGGSGGAGRV
jgi:hypothetical protein